MIDIIIGTVILLAWNGYLFYQLKKQSKKMDYLDRELESYQNRIDNTCDICGELNTEDWQCNCEDEEE